MLLPLVQFAPVQRIHATIAPQRDLSTYIEGKPNPASPNELSTSCPGPSLFSCLQCPKPPPFGCSASTLDETNGAWFTGSPCHESTSAADSSDLEDSPARHAATVDVPRLRYPWPNTQHSLSQLLEMVLSYCFGTADRSNECRFCAKGTQDEALFRVRPRVRRLEAIC